MIEKTSKKREGEVDNSKLIISEIQKLLRF